MIVTGPGPFWLILMFAVNALPGHTRAQPKTFSDPSKSKLSVPILNRIQKRSPITTLGKAFYALGDQVVRVGKLFYGATFIRRQNGVNFFEKPGGTKRAMRDFERVNPSSLKEVPSGLSLVGKVGNRIVTIRKGDDLFPDSFIGISKENQDVVESVIRYTD